MGSALDNNFVPLLSMKWRCKSKRSQEAYGRIEIFVLPILSRVTKFMDLPIDSLRKKKKASLYFGFWKMFPTEFLEAISKPIVTKTGAFTSDFRLKQSALYVLRRFGKKRVNAEVNKMMHCVDLVESIRADGPVSITVENINVITRCTIQVPVFASRNH